MSRRRWLRPGITTRFVVMAGGGAAFATAIVPTLGANLLANSDCELDASWSSYNSPTTRERSSTQAHSGTYSQHVVADEASAALNQGFSQSKSGQTVGAWFYLDAWAYYVSGSYIMMLFNATESRKLTGATGWEHLITTARATATTEIVYGMCHKTAEGYFDDIYLYPISLPSMLKTNIISDSQATVVAKVTGTIGTQIGVVSNLDDIANPLYGVWGYIDPGGKAYLMQNSNGVWTAKINGTAITYVAGQNVEIRHPSPSTYQLWYAGAQVGTDQTIEDAGINSNLNYCQFSTYAGNSFSGFSVSPFL